MRFARDPFPEGSRCHCHCTPSHTAVRAYARDLLVRAPGLRDYGHAVPARRPADLLPATAGWGRSLFACFTCFRRLACGDETGRLALRASLPGPDELRARLRAALLGPLPPRLLRRRLWDVASDLHDVPYYGPQAGAPGVRQGQRQQGTDLYFSYATAVLLRRGRRRTVALLPADSPKPAPLVAAVLGQLRQAGLRVRRLLIDRGPYAAAVVQLLRRQRLPFLVPLLQRGRLGPDGQATRTLAILRDKPAGPNEYRWRRRGPQSGPEVAVRVAVVPGRTRGGKARRLGYAFWGLGAATGLWLARQYRQRFGSETSSRQLRQGLGRTCRRGRRVRRRLVGLALRRRNVGVALHGEALAVRHRGGRRLRPGRLRLALLRLWLALAVAEELELALAVPAEQPTEQSGRHKLPA